MPKKEPRIRIKSKWVQGSQIVLNTILRYGEKTKKVTMTFPVEVLENKAQFRAMLEDAYEQNSPREVDLSEIPEEVE